MVSFDPYTVRITRLSARKSEQMKNFWGIKYANIYRLNTKIRLTMLFLCSFELYSRWVPLKQHATAYCTDNLRVYYSHYMQNVIYL